MRPEALGVHSFSYFERKVQHWLDSARPSQSLQWHSIHFFSKSFIFMNSCSYRHRRAQYRKLHAMNQPSTESLELGNFCLTLTKIYSKLLTSTSLIMASRKSVLEMTLALKYPSLVRLASVLGTYMRRLVFAANV